MASVVLLPGSHLSRSATLGARNNGSDAAFPFRNFTIDHIVPQTKGGTDHTENLQLLCNAYNSMEGTQSQAQFFADLKEAGLRS